FFSSRRRHTRFSRDWSSDVCSSDLAWGAGHPAMVPIIPIAGRASTLKMRPVSQNRISDLRARHSPDVVPVRRPWPYEPRTVLARHPPGEPPVSLRGEILPALLHLDADDASVPVRAFLAEVLDPLVELPPNVTPSLAVGDAVRDHLPAEQLRKRHVPV